MVYAEIALREHEETTAVYQEMQFAAVPRKDDYIEVAGKAYAVCFVTHTPSTCGVGSKIRVTVRPN